MYQLHPQLAADSIKLGHTCLSDVLLMNDCQYPWLVLVPRREQVRELYQLSAADQVQLHSESTLLAERLMQHFKGDKFNYAALGNMVPQFHLHLIVRHTSDAAWPTPIWGVKPMQAYAEQKLAELVGDLRTMLAESLSDFQAC